MTGKAGFVDVETTGLEHNDEIVELAIILFSFDYRTGKLIEVLDEYTGLREPKVPIHPRARSVHGLDRSQLAGKSLNRNRVQILISEADFLIAHNASFDRRFVSKLFPEAKDKTWLCSMSGISWKSRGFDSRGLQNLLRDHNVKPERAHRALSDVRSALKLLTSKNRNHKYNTYLHELLEKSSA
ncbi:MAG: exonuclease domain-containing protein [Halanaerobiales bacterium]